jgi:hypothetical protein
VAAWQATYVRYKCQAAAQVTQNGWDLSTSQSYADQLAIEEPNAYLTEESLLYNGLAPKSIHIRIVDAPAEFAVPVKQDRCVGAGVARRRRRGQPRAPGPRGRGWGQGTRAVPGRRLPASQGAAAAARQQLALLGGAARSSAAQGTFIGTPPPSWQPGPQPQGPARQPA